MQLSLDPTGTTSTEKSTATSAPKKGPDLDYNSFLQLLIAQMRHQDPLEPMKSSDYVAQLATFAQVEKTVQMNDRLGALLSSTLLQQAEALVGHEIASSDGSTSGVVAGAKVVDGRVFAVLTDGREVVVDTGVMVRRSGS
jgi:flagellar basal-body rod modification protein FlgD